MTKWEKKSSSCVFFCFNSVQQLSGAGGPMQSGQVPPNPNFLNRPPGPIPVSHSNVQQQVTAHTLVGTSACASLSRCLLWPVSACLAANTFPTMPLFVCFFHPTLLLSDLSRVQSVVVGMPPVSQVSMMEEQQQRQNNMVRPTVASKHTNVIRSTTLKRCIL